MDVVVALLFGFFLGGGIIFNGAHYLGILAGRKEMYKELTGEDLDE